MTKEQKIESVIIDYESLGYKVVDVQKDIPVDKEYSMFMLRVVESGPFIRKISESKEFATFFLWKENQKGLQNNGIWYVQVAWPLIEKAKELGRFKEEILDPTISELKKGYKSFCRE